MFAGLMEEAAPTHSMLESRVLEENWDYAEAETQLLTHGIHRYSGKFIPQIASRAISILSEPGELILDPYSGSGTTLLEAARLGRRAIGIDLNPLAVLIASAKIRPIDLEKLEAQVLEMSEFVSVLERGQAGLWGGSDFEIISNAKSNPRLADPVFTKWYQEDVLWQLVCIHDRIQALKEITRPVAMVAFSDILRRSSNAHSGYPNVMFDRNAPRRQLPARLFLKSLERASEMVSSLSSVEAAWNGVEARLGDARSLPFPDCSVDAVVTHPPYIGSIPYAEYGFLSLIWLGVDPKRLDWELTGGKRQTADVVERFQTAYRQMLLECSRVLKPGRHAFVMVGNPLVRGEIVNLGEMTLRLAQEAGLQVAAQISRQGVNRRANKMGEEQLLFFQKT